MGLSLKNNRTVWGFALESCDFFVDDRSRQNRGATPERHLSCADSMFALALLVVELLNVKLLL